MKKHTLRAAAAVVLLFAAAARADRVLVEGEQEATFFLYGMVDAIMPRDYENNGFRQKVTRQGDAVRVDVSVDLSPVRSRGAFPRTVDDLPVEAWLALQPTPEAPTDDPAILELDRWLLNDARTEYEAVTRVIDWVSTNVDYVVDPSLPTTAADTLKARKGYCVGMSNLAVAMLRTAGIPARDVHGILAQRPEALSGKLVTFSSAELHRFIEVYLSGVGWVYSDPLRTSHFIDALHVVLYPHAPGDPYDATLFKGGKLKLAHESDASYGIDRYKDLGRRVLVRPNLDGRYAAAVVGEARRADGTPIGAGAGAAVLQGQGVTRRRLLQRGGKFSFTGVAPGVYTLKVYAEGHVPSEQPVHVSTRDIKRLSVVLKRQ